MSLSLISWKPRMLEPSKPIPSLKADASNALIGMLKCCHVPGTSVNFTSTMRTPCSLASRITSSGVLAMRRITCFRSLVRSLDPSSECRQATSGVSGGKNYNVRRRAAPPFVAIHVAYRTALYIRPPLVKSVSHPYGEGNGQIDQRRQGVIVQPAQCKAACLTWMAMVQRGGDCEPKETLNMCEHVPRENEKALKHVA